MPAASALTTCSIFIDSMTSRSWSARTASPSATSMLTIVPWSGDSTGTAPGGGATPTSLVALRRAEAAYGRCVGLSGAGFAARLNRCGTRATLARALQRRGESAEPAVRGALDHVLAQ